MKRFSIHAGVIKSLFVLLILSFTLSSCEKRKELEAELKACNGFIEEVLEVFGADSIDVIIAEFSDFQDEVLKISSDSASLYKDNFNNWLEGKDFQASSNYMLSKEMNLAGIQQAIEQPYPNQVGNTGLFGLTEPVDPEDSITYSQMIYMIYPLDAEGHIINTGTNPIYASNLSENIVPCPPWCD